MTSSSPDFPSVQTISEAEQRYQLNYDRYSAERDLLTRRWNRIANLRLIVIAIVLGAIGWGIWQRSTPLLALGGVALVAFVALVVEHRRLGVRRRRASILAEINEHGLFRVRRDWDQLPLRDQRGANPNHPYAGDIDIVGPASLYHLLETVSTPIGSETLRRWLLDPSDRDTILARQGAVKELASQFETRQELALRGHQDRPFADPQPFLDWAEGPAWLAHRPWLTWLARLLAVVVVLTIVAHATGITNYPLWAPLLVVNLIVWNIAATPAHDIIVRAADQSASLQQYANQLDEIAMWTPESPELRRLHAAIVGAGSDAPAALRSLSRTVSWLIPRGSLAYLPAQALFLWDVHLLWALERWQHEHGHHVRTWLESLGEIESLAALATLAGDNPQWAFPEVAANSDVIAADQLGHPLIAGDVRVPNDIQVGPRGTFLLVTGSNMSGKSTLLRAIGVNAVLASAGGPVCATKMSLPPVVLWTSVRVTDSLAAGVSFFMAELLRLKAVVDAADHHAQHPDGRQFVYLLDEILQGTNTTERRTAARRIISHLMTTGAIGAVSTHDLDLADTPTLARSAQPVHFRESFVEGPSGPEMRFDHIMRPGIATTTNALRLMEAIGLVLPDLENDGAGAPAAPAPEKLGVNVE